MSKPDGDWFAYLDRFHALHPGITERVLTRCRSDGLDPYDWCAESLHGRAAPVLDIACGSAPMRAHLSRWIGTDISAAELSLAHARRRGPLVRSSADALPIATSTVEGVVCTVALQVIEPVSAAIAEAARVLQPSGHAVLLLPASGPLSLRQMAPFLRLQVALRRRIAYPNDRALRRHRLAQLTALFGLTVTGDERRTFRLPVETEQQADEFLQSLYLPGIASRRLQRAQLVLARHTGVDLAVPLRRVVLERSP